MKKFFLQRMNAANNLRLPTTRTRSLDASSRCPRVQWAVVESTEGTMPQIIEMGARILASTSANEAGTYALYGVIIRT